MLFNQLTSQPPGRQYPDPSHVTCLRCKQQGHYTNTCQNPPVQHNATNQPQPQQPTQNITKVHRQQSANNGSYSRPIHTVDIVGDTPTVTESPTVTYPDTPTLTKSDHILNKFNEPEAFVTQGMVNNIATAIILDSGAKLSVVSQDFIAHDSHPVA